MADRAAHKLGESLVATSVQFNNRALCFAIEQDQSFIDLDMGTDSLNPFKATLSIVLKGSPMHHGVCPANHAGCALY